MVLIYNDPPVKYSDDNLKNIDSAIAQMAGLLQNLSTKTEELPKIDQNGDSECPWAENMYAEQVELIKKAGDKLNELSQFQGIVNQIIDQHHSNIDQINNDCKSLNTSTVKQGYSFAEMTAQHHLKNAQEHKSRLEDMIKWSNKVLGLANEKKFPGGNPEKRFQPPDAIPNAGHTLLDPMTSLPESINSPVKTTVNSGINDLISMGPIGGIKSSF